MPFRSATTNSDSSFASTTIAISAPAGVAQNDQQIIWYASAVGAPAAAPTHTTPSGWTARQTFTFSEAGGAFNARLTLYTRTAGASEGSVTLTSSANAGHIAQRLAYFGINTSTPFDVSNLGAFASGTTATASSITTTVDNTLINAFFTAAGVGITFTPPSGMTERTDADSAESSDVQQASAGATGNKTATLSSAADGAWGMVALAGDIRAVSATTEALTLTGQKATVARARAVAAGTESLTLTAQNAAIARGRGVSAATEALTLTGQNAAVSRARAVNAATESLTLTAHPAVVSRGTSRVVSATTEALTLTGQTASIVRGRAVQCATAQMLLSGQTALVTRGIPSVRIIAGGLPIEHKPKRKRKKIPVDPLSPPPTPGLPRIVPTPSVLPDVPRSPAKARRGPTQSEVKAISRQAEAIALNLLEQRAQRMMKRVRSRMLARH